MIRLRRKKAQTVNVLSDQEQHRDSMRNDCMNV